MPAIAALTINDGQSSPAAHTFNPVTTDGSKAQWADRAPAVPAGYINLSHEVLPPNGTRTVHKVQLGYMLPTLGSDDFANKVVRYSSAQLTLNLHPESSLQERKDLLAYIANSLGLTDVKNSVWNIEPFY